MERILIVEDSPTQAEALRLIVESEGFDAEIASDGEAALRLLPKTRFDAVISDIVMPGMSGYSLCHTIKANPEWKSIPVVLLTTRKDPLDIFRGLECGADNFYTKPYDAKRLVERIRHIIFNRKLRSQNKLRTGVEIAFFGKTFFVDSDKEQILDLLISSFEDTVQTNLELEHSRNEVAAAKAKIEEYAKLLENRVQSSEGLNTAIIENVSNGIVTIDEAGVLRSFNRAAERIFGSTNEEVVGQSIAILIPESSKEIFEKAIAVYRGSEPDGLHGQAPVELEGRRSDGDRFPMALGLAQVKIGERTLLVAVIEDLSQRRSTERQLRQAQKMEAVGQLAGGIAHDFNNLLTVVISNLELLKEMVPLEERAKRMLDSALRAGDRGATLTRRLLAFSRQQAFDYKVWDIGELIDDMEEILRRTLGETIAVKTVVPSGDWLTLTNEAEFESALLNLAINSRDAMPGGGQLTIEVRAEFLDDSYVAQYPGLKTGEYVCVCVSDTGQGIAPHQQERIFEPFFTTKEVGKGTGLGLSMVYGFVKQSGGHINLYSEVGHGTSVRLYLPRLADVGVVKSDTGQEAAEPAAPSSPKVLIVDDNDDVRQVGVATLKLLSCRVVEARDPKEALIALDEHDDIDVLFTDLIMPGGMNGVELAAEARKRRPNLKVLFCSGFAASAMVDRHMLVSGEAFVAKPYRRSDLAGTLNGVMTRKLG
jgi:PAS domain S-box-containing protein